MNNFDLVILISILILILILNKVNKVKKISKIKIPIQKKNNIITNNKIDLKKLNKYNNFITTNIDDNELDKLNINKGNITRNTIIEEKGGSKNFNNFIINSNISNNLINYDNTKSTYTKLPYKIK